QPFKKGNPKIQLLRRQGFDGLSTAEKIVKEQLATGIIEKAPQTPTGERTFYMPHKPVIREYATTTKVRMVFDASAKPNPLANSINDCMYTGPPRIRVRMSTHIQKAFLQIGIQEGNRDAFLFPVQYQRHGTTSPVCRSNNIFGVPFGVEASPFMLGNEQQPL
ncbi:Hypothetical predicted protein, partial [Paramuricea clavata]